MDKHTPEPWSATSSVGEQMLSYSQPCAIHGEGGNRQQLIAGCFGDVRGGIEQCEANARRIVAAVNACAGIPASELELAARDGKFLHAYDTIRKQRDELLAICKSVVENGIGGNDVRAMRDAITKAEEA